MIEIVNGVVCYVFNDQVGTKMDIYHTSITLGADRWKVKVTKVKHIKIILLAIIFQKIFRNLR